jgi:predicted acyltransferase
MKGHMQRPDFESKGILSTFPALVITLFGVMTGQYLRTDRTNYEKMTHLYFLGFIGLIIGLMWDACFPINQSLWTSSLVVLSSGLALLCFASCYFLADIKKITLWSKPFVVFGTNALTAYFCSTLLSRTLDLIKLNQPDSKTISIKTFMTDILGFAGSPQNRMLFFAILYVLFWLGILTILYRRRIFIKI